MRSISSVPALVVLAMFIATVAIALVVRVVKARAANALKALMDAERAARAMLEQELTEARGDAAATQSERAQLQAALSASSVATEALRTTLHQLTSEVSERLLQHQSQAFSQTRAAIEERANAEVATLRDLLDTTANERISAQLAPVADALVRVEGLVHATQSTDAAISARLEALMQQLTDEQRRHWNDTRELHRAFRSAQSRGQFGEFTLVRALEGAGLRRGVHFDEQPSDRDEAGRFRPDVLIRLPDGRVIVVDSKAPMDSLLAAQGVSDPDEHDRLLRAHATAVRRHVEALARRDYPSRTQESQRLSLGGSVWPGALLFIPSETALDAALHVDETLLRAAAALGVYLVSPTTLMVVLNCVDALWRHDQLDRRAMEIIDAGSELYGRLMTVVENVEEVGKSISRSVGTYNALVGSVQSRLGPGARRLREIAQVRDAERGKLQRLTGDVRSLAPKIREELAQASAELQTEGDGRIVRADERVADGRAA
jgi:DNA recombination protein RmuC